MPRRVVVQSNEGQFDLVEVAAKDEYELQDIVKKNPQLLPADDLGFDDDLLVIGRETTLASGYIDLMCLARTGDIVLIEFKTGPKNPDFRHALAQLIDYGSDLWRQSLEDFESVVERYLKGKHCLPAFATAADLWAAIALTGWNLTDLELDSLRRRIVDVLATGDFTFVVAAQRFTPSMQTSLDYLNFTTRAGRFFLVEVVALSGRELTAYASQVVARPPARSVSFGSAGQTNESEFLAKITSDAYREAMGNIFDACRSLGMTIHWGSGGSSLRIATTDRAEPLSVGWTFLEGAQWYSAKHLTLGVDPASLQGAPSVAVAVRDYIAEVGAIAGAAVTPGKLNAYTFAPDVVPCARAEIIAAIEKLVQSTSGGQVES